MISPTTPYKAFYFSVYNAQMHFILLDFSGIVNELHFQYLSQCKHLQIKDHTVDYFALNMNILLTLNYAYEVTQTNVV